MNIKLNNSEGFTLIELMLAMTIFSAVMVVATVGFIGMNRTGDLYVKNSRSIARLLLKTSRDLFVEELMCVSTIVLRVIMGVSQTEQ